MSGFRTGSDQRNFSVILNPMRYESIYGNKIIANELYLEARSIDVDYCSGKISLQEYCEELCKIVSKAGSTVDPKSFYKKCARTLPRSTSGFKNLA